MAGGAAGFFGVVCGQIVRAGQALDLLIKALHQPQRLGLDTQRETPERQALGRVVQFQRAHPAVVQQAQRQARAQRPFLPCAGAGIAGQQAPGRHHQEPRAETQVRAQVNLQGGPHVFFRSEQSPQPGPQGAIQDTQGVHRMVILHFVWYLRPGPATAPVGAQARILPEPLPQGGIGILNERFCPGNR